MQVLDTGIWDSWRLELLGDRCRWCPGILAGCLWKGHGEVFEGALVALPWPLLGPIIAENHAAVNQALQNRCAVEAK